MTKPTPDVRGILEQYAKLIIENVEHGIYIPLPSPKIEQAITELNKQAIENYLTKVYGKRCKSKDIDDAPELKESGNNRCLTCKVWEHYDEEQQI